MSHIIFIAGAGQDKTAWASLASTLSNAWTTHLFSSADLSSPFSVQDSADSLNRYMAERNIDFATICGLSLGAMIGTEFAIHYPERVRSLILCGSQVRPNKALMSLQSSIMRLFPEKLLGLPSGLTKSQLLDLLHESSRIDLTDSLGSIKTPTLAVCGAQDRPNLPASRYLAKHIANANLQIIQKSGTSNQHPQQS